METISVVSGFCRLIRRSSGQIFGTHDFHHKSNKPDPSARLVILEPGGLDQCRHQHLSIAHQLESVLSLHGSKVARRQVLHPRDRPGLTRGRMLQSERIAAVREQGQRLIGAQIVEPELEVEAAQRCLIWMKPASETWWISKRKPTIRRSTQRRRRGCRVRSTEAGWVMATEWLNDTHSIVTTAT